MTTLLDTPTEETQLPDLRTRAMLATLNISVWNPKRKDKVATLETLIKHNASRDAGAFIKNLLPDGAIDPVKKAESTLRRTFYSHTLPWQDNGIRILPSAAWADFSSEERAARADFDTAVGQFLLDYDAHRAKAQVSLNGLFNHADYPPVDEVRSKFGVNISWMPLPDSGDFRVDMPEEDMKQIRDELSRGTEVAMGAAKADLYNRLSTALVAVTNRLDEPGKVFRDSLINNLRTVCKEIPKLNVMDDAGILKLATEAERVANLDPEAIRMDDNVRAKANQTATDILENMGFYGATTATSNT
jgi:hypothetical protein